MPLRVRSPAFYVLVLLAAVWCGVVYFQDEAPLPDAQSNYIPPASSQAVTPIPLRIETDQRKAALGRLLFHDPRLSGDDRVSCATCHDLKLAGQDGRPVARGIQGRLGTVNSPTVLNSGFNFRQFWDGRAATLEEQAEGPVHNPLEMDTTWKDVTAKLGADPALRAAFAAIWQDGIKPAHIQEAIAEFERSLITPDAPFDRFLRGDAQAISAQAKEGWREFRELGCIACHQGVNLGGNMYSDLGVMGDWFADQKRPLTKSDLGRFNVTGRAADRHVFKVPGLRNVARTAPYFHDGSVPTLEGAIQSMARYQLGIDLSRTQERNLAAFLASLDGKGPMP